MKLQKVGIFIVRRVLPVLVVVALVALLAFFLFFDSLAQGVLEDVDRELPGRLTVDRFSPTWKGLKLSKVEWRLGSEPAVFEAKEIWINLGFQKLLAGNYYRSVDQVVVEEPKLRVVVDSSGNLNLLNLIPQNTGEQAFDLSQVRSEARIERGRILYRDRRDAGFLYSLTDVDGTMLMKNGEELTFGFSSRPDLSPETLLPGETALAPEDQGRLRLEGLIGLQQPRFEAKLGLDKIALDPFAGYPGFGPGLTLVEGSVSGSMRATGEGNTWNDALANLFLLGDIGLEEGAFRSPRMPAALRKLAAQVELLGSGVTVKSLSGEAAGIPFHLQGQGRLGGDNRISADLQVPKFSVEKLNTLLQEPLPVTGFAEADISVEGSLEDWMASGKLKGYDLESNGEKVERIETDFLKASDLIHFSGLSVQSEAGDIEGEGWIFLGEEPRVLVSLRGRGADPEVLLPGFARSADFELRVLGDPDAPMAYGQGNLSGLGEWSQGMTSAQGRFVYSGSDLLLYNGQANKGDSVVSLPLGALDLKNKTFAGILRTAGFRAEDLPGVQGVTGRFAGSAMVEADLSGEEVQLQAQARLDSGNFSAAGMSVADATGHMMFDGKQVVLSRAAGSLDGGEVEVSGTYDLRNDGVQFVIQGQGVSLASLGLPSESANLSATVQGTLGGTLGVYGLVESAMGKAALSGYQDPDGQVHGVAWVDGLHQGVEVETTVVASGLPSDLDIDYSGRLNGGALAQLGPVDLFGSARLLGSKLRLKPTVIAAADAPTDRLFYPLTTYSGAAYSFFGPLMAGPLEKVVIEESPFPKARSLVVAGGADLESGRLDLGFNMRAAGLEEVPLPEIATKLPFELLSGFGKFGGKIGGTLANPIVEARFLFPWLMLGDADDKRLTLGTRGRFELGRDLLKVTGMTISQVSMDSRLSERRTERGADGLLRVSGSISTDESFDARVKTDGFAPDFFAFFVPQWTRSWLPSGRMATDNLHLWGTLAKPNISGEVELSGGGIMLAGEPYSIRKAFIDFSSQQGEIRIPRLGLLAPGLEVSGNVTRTAAGALSGQISADQIELSKLERFGGALSGLNGTAQAAIKLGGSFPSAPQAELGFRTENLVWNPRAIGGKDQPVSIEKLVLGRFEENELAEGLTVSTTEKGVYIQLPSDGFQFIRAQDGLKVQASGAVSLPSVPEKEFKTFKSLAEYLASPWGPDFGRQGEPLTLAVDRLTTTEAAHLLGRETRGVELTTSFDVSLEGQWWRDHAKASGSSLPHYELALKELEFEAGEKGKSSGLRLDNEARLRYQREGDAGFLTLEDWQVGFFREQELPEGEQDLTREDRLLRQGVIDAAGKLAITALPGTEPVSEFYLGGADIPLANLSFLLPSGLPLSGLVDSLEVSLNGVLPSPKLELAALVTDLTVGPAERMRLEGSVSGRKTEKGYRLVIGEGENEAVLLTFGESDPAGHAAKVDGEAEFYWKEATDLDPERLELFAKNLQLSLDSPIHLSAEILDRNLEVLADLLPGQESTSGTFQGSLLASGTLKRPEFEGHALLENGRVDSKELGRFENLNLDAKVNRITKEEATPSLVLEEASSGFLTRLQIEKWEGLLGGKPFFGGGKAEFAGISPTFLDLFFVGESLPVKIPKLFTGQVDIDLELVGEIARSNGVATLTPSLQGLLIIPQGDFWVPLGGSDLAADATPPPVPLNVALDISLGREFFARALDSRIRAVGELKLSSKDGQTKLVGQTALSRGQITIPFYDATFRVRQGTANFDGPFIPDLENVQAVTDLGGYRITAVANGRYPDTFKLQLYSDPPLPQSELNRVAVLGGLPSTLTGASDPNQTSSSSLGTLSNQGVSFLSGILTNRLTDKIGKFLFLSELSFDYIPPATYAIKLAKALDPEDTFLITVTRIIRDNGLNENLFGVEWRFTPTLLLRAAFDQLARPRFWVQSINRF